MSKRALVVAVSYSGNTAETLAGLEQALASGLPVAAVSTGGAVAALAAEAGFPLVEVPGRAPAAGGSGLPGRCHRRRAPRRRRRRRPAARTSPPPPMSSTGCSTAAKGPDGSWRPTWPRRWSIGCPVIIGGQGPASIAAGRWATQFHENAKRPAFAATIPEMNHNLFEALAGTGSGAG